MITVNSANTNEAAWPGGEEEGMPIASGSIVEITGRVIKLKGKTTSIFVTKLSTPTKAIILGKSNLYTGTLTGGSYDYDDYQPSYLTSIISHAVWMVMPLSGNRYRKPIAVLEEQIQQEKVQP